MSALPDLSKLSPSEKLALGRTLSKQLAEVQKLNQSNPVFASYASALQSQINKIEESLAPTGVLPVGMEYKNMSNNRTLITGGPPPNTGFLEGLADMFAGPKPNNRPLPGFEKQATNPLMARKANEPRFNQLLRSSKLLNNNGMAGGKSRRNRRRNRKTNRRRRA